jgi:hypothetical protein
MVPMPAPETVDETQPNTPSTLPSSASSAGSTPPATQPDGEGGDTTPRKAVAPAEYPTKVRAIANFAYFHEVDINTVLLSDLGPNDDSWMEWAQVGLKLDARSPPAQALNRAMAHRPDVKAKHTALLDCWKMDFLTCFSEDKNFDFLSESRSHTVEQIKRRDDIGEWLTYLQIVKLLGGQDNPEAVRQARHYILKCQSDELKDWQLNLTTPKLTSIGSSV